MSWLLKIYLITVYLYSNVSSNDIILPTDYTNQDAESLSKCVVKIRDQGIVQNPTILVIKRTDIQLKNDDELFLNSMIETIANESVPIIVTNEIDYNKIMPKIAKGSLIAILLLNDCETARKVKDDALSISIKYLFLLKLKPNEECINTIENHKKYVQEQDVTFIFKDDFENKYIFLTFIPQRKEDTCNGSTAVQINTCVDGSLDKAIVFPQKSVTNLGRCPIYMGLYGRYPFVKYNIASTTSRKEKWPKIKVTGVAGSDVEIMKIIAERLNANANFVKMTRENLIPYIVSNKIQVLGGGLSFESIQGQLTLTAPYGAYKIQWGYAAIRPIRQWSNFISNINGIYFFFGLYIGYSFIWKFITHFDGHAVQLKETLLYGWGALVGAASLQPARSMKQKILNISYLIMCIHLSTYFSTQLYSFLVIQKPPEMFRTHEDILNSGRKPFISMELEQIEDPKFIKFKKTGHFCPVVWDCAMKMFAVNGVILCRDIDLYNLCLSTAVNDEVRLLQITETVILKYLHFLLGNRNLANNYIDKIATILFEAGISQKLYLDSVGANVVSKAKIAAKTLATNDYSCQLGCKISLPQIAPVFYVWMAGCAFSCFVFMLELLWNIKSLRSFFIYLKRHIKVPTTMFDTK